MVPKIAGQGSSFKGATDYYLHDKKAETDRRVEFTYTRNLSTDDPEMAWRWMAKTAADSERLKAQSGADLRGAKSEKPVFTLSLSWHPDEEPEQEHMIDAMQSALDALGLKEHQTLMVSHNDEPQPHIHAIVNLVHPQTGKTPRLKNSKERLSEWALAYEQEHGLYCHQRVENSARREAEKSKRQEARAQGQEYQKADFPRNKEREDARKAEITARYFASDSGQAFVASMDELGFTVAKGRRLLLIDRATGDEFSLYRQIDGAKPAAIKGKLAGLDIPLVDDARSRQAEALYVDRDAQTRDQDERIIDAGIVHGADDDRQVPRALPSPAQQAIRDFGRDRPAPAGPPFATRDPLSEDDSPTVRNINRLQDAQLAIWGAFYDRSARDRAQVEANVESAYGREERALRQAIHRREEGFERAGWLRRWYLKSFRHEQDALEADRRTLSDVERRAGEMRGAVEARIRDERAQLEDRFGRERAAFQTPKQTPSQERLESSTAPPATKENMATESPSPVEAPRERVNSETVTESSAHHDAGPIDPFVASLAAQQAAASRAYLGAAAPSYVPATYDASPTHPSDYDAARAAHMDRAAATQEMPSDPALSPGESDV